MSNEVAVDIVLNNDCAEKAANILCQEAFKRGSYDNISVIVVKF